MRFNQSSFRRALAPVLAAACGAAILAFIGSPVAITQSRIIPPQRNSNSSAKRPPVTTLRANDSPEGSRVAVTANQSLNDYEAYRRGDRFYVRIPAADVPRPEAVKGRAFNDVKVQRGASDTVVSFRLQPGASARVEQRGNKLDVVFTMPGARSSGSATTSRNDPGPAPPAAEPQRRGNTNSDRSNSGSPDSSTRNSNERSTTAGAGPNADSSASSSPGPGMSTSPGTAARTAPVVARSSPSPTAAGPTTATGTTWSQLKQKARYWILLAQLNPVPVGIAVALLLLIIGLFALQRRRARVARRARWRNRSVEPEAAAKAAPVPAAASVPAAAPVAAAASVPAAVSVPAAAATTVATAAEPDDAKSETETVVPVVPQATVAGAAAPAGTVAAGLAMASARSQPKPPPVSVAQQERVTRTSEEVKKLMAGGDYDESIIASDDRYTRQLVGAELSSALVGRNLQRRERARAAFMNHGYFDDATRDLRIGDSANERAAAARRLSFVRDREATPHLIAALDDASPDVRRAAVEALMDLRDPAAIAPLNSLMQTENDRRVPRSLIKHAVEACATSSPDDIATHSQTALPSAARMPVAETVEPEREVIEI